MHLPFFLIWHIWLARNQFIFEDKKPDITSIALAIKNQLLHYPVKLQHNISRRNIGPAPTLNYPVGFFDGASTRNKGGAGIMLMLSLEHHFHFKMGLGISTNARAKLLALWTLLCYAKSMGLPHLHIFGNSAVIINWFNHRSALSLITLDGWCLHIRELESHFICLTASHIYREHNTYADSLSKEALTLASGHLHFLEFSDGMCIHQGSHYLF